MGTPFKIPKKKQPSSSSSLYMSPLSRVQDGDASHKTWTQFSYNGKKPQKSSSANGKINTSSGTDSSMLSTLEKSEVRNVAKVNGTLVRAGGTSNSRPLARTPAADNTSISDQNRWRPKRASDTLCQQGKDTPAIKKLKGSGLAETWKAWRMGSEEDEDGDVDRDKHISPVKEEKRSSSAAVKQQASNRSLTSVPPKAVEVKGNGEKARTTSNHTTNQEEPEKLVKTPGVKTAPSLLVTKSKDDGSCFRGRLSLRHSYKTYQKRAKPSSTEPIVLSSGDEDEGTNEGNDDAGSTRAQQNKNPQKTNRNQSGPGEESEKTEAPSILELAFSTLHFGSACFHSNGPIVITNESISIPLKADDGVVVVAVVPSELHGYGVWDGALANDGVLLSVSRQPSPSLLFLSLSDAQTRLLHTELSCIHPPHISGQPCQFVLVTLATQLDELRVAQLASLMDVIGLRYGLSFLAVPLSWSEGLNLLHCHPQGGQLLTLLGQGDSLDGQSTERERTNEHTPADIRPCQSEGVKKASEGMNTRHSSLRSHSRQQTQPRRLIQYPPPPSKGGITVTTEDLECLRDGEFLNDVIIDFYLKYLQLERADEDVANRSHVFSSFFYKQLTRRDNCNEEEAGGTAQYRRHRRVRTWTRHVDIFSKDYVFIPVNQEAHWYMVVICFPGLLQPESIPCLASVDGPRATHKQLHRIPCTGQHQTGSIQGTKHQSNDLPDCTVLNCQREKVTRRPCILIMDSLKVSYHYRIYTLLREYLQVEWEVRRGTPRVFNDDSIRGCHCKVPQQDNSSDCGLYLLQYVESFLQNPVVHFELPLRLERWFPRQQVRRKRQEIRELVLQLHKRQGSGAESSG
ncbi:sentrin-specific protease 7-like [Hoplias malabaricus]|uniref:sentrin-specific protease 7-like n=1 Tax=Hoplias malabaricus TaxID=27720 RepID=UPI003461AD8C